MVMEREINTVAMVLTAYATLVGVGAAIAYYLALSLTKNYLSIYIILAVDSSYLFLAFIIAKALFKKI